MKRPKLVTPPDSERFWDSWTDVLGQEYRVGDLVSVATISGKSPQMVIAEVTAINRMRKDPWTRIDGEDGDYHFGPAWVLITKGYKEPQPSCTIKALPLVDARGFYRTGDGRHWNRQNEERNVKQVTYQIPNNIIKLSLTREELEALQKDGDD